MSTRINNNILSLTAQRNIWHTQNSLDQAVERLSSGLRLNKSWEDPAGMAVSERFRAQISSMVEAERNASYAINLIQTAEGGLSVIDEKLIRMRALAIQASNGQLTSGDRLALHLEFDQLRSEVDRIARTTNYNGLKLLNGDFTDRGIKFHIGTYNVREEDYYYVNMGDVRVQTLGIDVLDLREIDSAQMAIDAMDIAIDSKDSLRTRIGAYVNRLQNTILNLQISREAATQSESQIRDADVAAEMSDFVRAQILMQAGISMLSQANSIPQIVAQLIG